MFLKAAHLNPIGNVMVHGQSKSQQSWGKSPPRSGERSAAARGRGSNSAPSPELWETSAQGAFQAPAQRALRSLSVNGNDRADNLARFTEQNLLEERV